MMCQYLCNVGNEKRADESKSPQHSDDELQVSRNAPFKRSIPTLAPSWLLLKALFDNLRTLKEKETLRTLFS